MAEHDKQAMPDRGNKAWPRLHARDPAGSPAIPGAGKRECLERLDQVTAHWWGCHT
jgi:hypothetical protein